MKVRNHMLEQYKKILNYICVLSSTDIYVINLSRVNNLNRVLIMSTAVIFAPWVTKNINK